MKVYLAAPRGFCAGVDRAIKVVETALERFGPPVYLKHQIVHSQYVVDSLEARGAVTVEDVRDIPEGATVVFSAHGSPPDDFKAARDRKLNVIDGTCPLVTKVHSEARKYSQEGRKIILVGHRDHQEVKGTTGQVPMALVDDREPLDLPDWDESTEVAILTQTTLSVDDARRSVESIQERFSKVILRNDLCYATTNRQAAVKELCELAEIVLVVGAPNSSNCARLREVAQTQGRPAYLIAGPEGLDPSWLAGVESVGIISGASTPEILVDRVLEMLRPDEVTHVQSIQEDVNFLLPRELR